MPEIVTHPTASLPAAKGKGAEYVPVPQEMKDGEMRAHTVQTIAADAQSLYELWHNVELAPRWQEYVISVVPVSDTTSHWVLGNPDHDSPKAARIEYDSKIVADEPGKRIAWESITDGVSESGEVTFEPAPGGRGTRVTLKEFAKVPGGKLGNAVAGLSKRTPRQVVIEDLRHFKQLAETGEIPSVVINSHGPRGLVGSFKERMYGENNPTPPGTSNL